MSQTYPKKGKPFVHGELRTAYGPKLVVNTDPGEGPSLAQQQFKDATDINNIMKKYVRTGVIDHVNRFEAWYGLVDGQTFTESMFTVANAQNMFNELPAAAREKFDHDPAKFLDFVKDAGDGSKDQMLSELGLLDPAAQFYQPKEEPEPLPEPPAPAAEEE